MPDRRDTAGRLALLGSLYAAQGLPFGFFTQTLPVVLREQGTSLELIGASAVLAAPWALKALWAPLIERTATLRRWVLGLQVASVITMIAVAAFEPASHLGLLAAAVLMMNLLAATQDIGTDGIAVAILRPDERGWGNGLQVAAYRVGMIFGGAVLLIAYASWGWAPTVLALAGGLAALSIPLWVRPTPVSTEPPPSWRGSWDWLGLPGAAPWIGVLVLFKLGDYLVQGMLRPWLVDIGTDLVTIGTGLGGVGFTAGLVGAVVGGAVVGARDRLRTLAAFGVLHAGALGLMALAATGISALVWPAIVFEHFVGGCVTAALFTAMMDRCRPDRGATDYTLQASLVVVASLLGAGLSGVVATAFGYAGVFGVGAGLATLAPVLLFLLGASGVLSASGQPSRRQKQ